MDGTPQNALDGPVALPRPLTYSLGRWSPSPVVGPQAAPSWGVQAGVAVTTSVQFPHMGEEYRLTILPDKTVRAALANGAGNIDAHIAGKVAMIRRAREELAGALELLDQLLLNNQLGRGKSASRARPRNPPEDSPEV